MKTIDPSSIEYLTPPSMSNLGEENTEKSTIWSNRSASILVSWSSADQRSIQYTRAPFGIDQSDASINDAMANLRSTVELIHSNLAFIPRSTDFEELLTRAASQHGTPDNVPEWAETLASDVADLSD